MAFDPEVFVNQYLAVESFVQYLAYYRGVSKPTVSLGVTSAVVSSCGHDSGQNRATRCALIGGALGDP